MLDNSSELKGKQERSISLRNKHDTAATPGSDYDTTLKRNAKPINRSEGGKFGTTD